MSGGWLARGQSGRRGARTEGIDHPIAFVDDDDGASDGVADAATAVGGNAIEPDRVGGNVLLGGQVDVGTILSVQSIEVVEGQRVGDVVD